MSHILAIARRTVRRIPRGVVSRAAALVLVAGGALLMLTSPRVGQAVTAVGALVTMAESVASFVRRDPHPRRRRRPAGHTRLSGTRR